MLKSLYIKNIALIKELSIEFEGGLNILSGETGAGKSIIIDSVNLILGERADKELIGKHAESAVVEGSFKIDQNRFLDFFEENAIDADEELIITRQLTSAGKNICRINGVMVSLAILKGLTDKIVDLHGQHEHQSLLYRENHLKFIDAFVDLKKEKDAIHKLLAEYGQINNRLASIGTDTKKRQEEIDLLTYQTEEIEKASLKIGELEALKEERNLLINAGKIYEVLNIGYEGLYNGTEYSSGAVSVIKSVVDSLGSIAEYSKEYADLHQRLTDSYYTFEESAHELNSLANNIEFDEARQNEVEMRVDLINNLLRKYGGTEEDVLEYFETSKQRIEDLLNSESMLIKLNKEKDEVYLKLYEKYTELSAKRKKAGKKVADLLIKELKDLGMINTRFEVMFTPMPQIEEKQTGNNGLDECEFYISANAGEDLKPLSKTSSGGEISRIMLAFKNISAGTDNISTLIFDEIDTGISGKMAQVVAKKMAQIAKTRQVICVTHLPQIAAMADKNFLIEKSEEKNTTNTKIVSLNEKEKLKEIVRLIGGIESANAQVHAMELVENAQKLKESI